MRAAPRTNWEYGCGVPRFPTLRAEGHSPKNGHPGSLGFQPRRLGRLSFLRSTCSNMAVMTPAKAEIRAPTKRKSAVVFQSEPFPGRPGWDPLGTRLMPQEISENSVSEAARINRFRDMVGLKNRAALYAIPLRVKLAGVGPPHIRLLLPDRREASGCARTKPVRKKIPGKRTA
jgi:hypothetical protein